MEKPLLICLTPVRNEAWILHAFLKATSLWADYIIMADQNSSDGSLEIAQSYPKVILIDNSSQEMHQARTRQLLFKEALKIKGDKILFTLNADEFLSGNFRNTKDWNTIIESQTGEVFCFRWTNLLPKGEFYRIGPSYYWAIHITDSLEGIFPDNHIHEWRLPWPEKISDKMIHNFEEIRFIHFARVNELRQKNKEKFYQVSTIAMNNKTSTVSMFRMYNTTNCELLYQTDMKIFDWYKEYGLDILSEIDLSDEGEYYINEIKKFFDIYGVPYFSKLYIWDNNFLKKLNIDDPRNIIYKSLHCYLKRSQNISKYWIIRIIDKLLKKVI